MHCLLWCSFGVPGWGSGKAFGGTILFWDSFLPANRAAGAKFWRSAGKFWLPAINETRSRGTQLPQSMLRLGRLAIVVLLAASLLAVPAWATVTHGANMWMWGSNERGQLGLGQMGTSWSDSVNQKVNTPTEGDTFWPGWIGKNVTKVDCVRACARAGAAVLSVPARVCAHVTMFFLPPPLLRVVRAVAMRISCSSISA